MAKTKTQFGNAVRSLSLTLTFMACLNLGSVHSIGNPNRVSPCLPISMLQQEAGPVINRNNFNHRTISLIPVFDENKFEESSPKVSPKPKAVKSKQKIGDGKKTGMKIFLITMAGIFLAAAVISIGSIPFLQEIVDEPSSGIVPMGIGLGVIFLRLLWLTLKDLSKVNRETAHLEKQKSPKGSRNKNGIKN